MTPAELKEYWLEKWKSIVSVALLTIVSLLATYHGTTYFSVFEFNHASVNSSAEANNILGLPRSQLHATNQNLSDSVRFGRLRDNVTNTNRTFYQAKGSFAAHINFTVNALKKLNFSTGNKYQLPGIESMDKYTDPRLMINATSVEVISQRRDYRLIVSDNNTCDSLNHPHGFNSFNFKNDVFLLMGIKSTCNHRFRRDAIRETWGNESRIFSTTGVRVKLVFLLGACVNNEDTDKLWDESTTHSDILQWDFMDSFHNLSLKHCLLWQWYATHCMEVPFLVQGDDDMLMNMRNILEFLMTLPVERERDLWTGSPLMGQPPVRVNTSRYYVSRRLYPDKLYPPYVSGGGFLISGSLVVRLWIATFWKYMLPVDDAFVGTLAKAVGVKPTNGRKSFASWGLKDPTPYCLSTIKTYHKALPFELITLWEEMNEYYESINANYTADHALSK